MKTSRQRIYEYIRAQRTVTIGELSEALHSSEANIRHHLSLLQENGLIEVTGERPSKGKGRPAQIFGPSKESLGDNLELLTEALLDEIEASLPEMARQRLVERVTERFSGMRDRPESAPASPTGPIPLRLIQAVQRLNEHHYQAHWEARPDGPRIILGHCPFGAVIEGHPWLCEIDARLLERYTGQPVEQIERLASDGRGGRHCIFRIQP